jgi:hypothetical protein
MATSLEYENSVVRLLEFNPTNNYMYAANASAHLIDGQLDGLNIDVTPNCQSVCPKSSLFMRITADI